MAINEVVDSTGARGDWICTYTGRSFYPLSPSACDVVIEDVAHSLSNQCRFAGHCRSFYSVAEHCVRASYAVVATGTELKQVATRLVALLHDASEAYLVDLPRPIKKMTEMAAYSKAETKCWLAIVEALIPRGAHWDPQAIKSIDNVMLATEKRDLMPARSKEWGPLPSPLSGIISPWTPAEAKEAFLTRYNELHVRLTTLLENKHE